MQNFCQSTLISIRKPRNERLNRPPAAEEVHSGDAFYVMRLDGLNTMLAWAMGSTTGRTDFINETDF